MDEIVYILCGLASMICAWLLWRSYQQRRSGLLFWACACFACMALANLLLPIGLIFYPAADIPLIRHALNFAGLLMLVHGLISEAN